MVAKTKDIETLVALFLNGEATPEQAIKVTDWISQSDENKQLFLDLEKVHAVSNSTKVFKTEEASSLWKEHLKNMDNSEAKVISFNFKKAFMAIAAVLVVALIATLTWFNSNDTPTLNSGIKKMPQTNLNDNRVLTAANGLASFKLSDQSEIMLENGSQLILDKDFNKKERRLRLKGSGEFHVIHNEEVPFILSVNKLEIFDIGTIFRVNKIGDTIRVCVDEGEVELRLNGQIINMIEGDSAFYLVQDDLIRRYPTKKARKDHTFVFEGTSLKDVASVLSKFFDQPIVVKDKAVERCPLTVRFKNENLITILDIIKELMDVEIVQNKKSIEIYGKGCN